MINIEEIVQRLALPPQDLEIQKGKKGVDRVQLRLVGDDIAISSFRTYSEKITQAFGEAAEKDDSDRERSWRWEIDGISLHLYLFEQHCYKLALTIYNRGKSTAYRTVFACEYEEIIEHRESAGRIMKSGGVEW